MIYYPQRLSLALVLRLFVSPTSLPLCFGSLLTGKLCSFEVTAGHFLSFHQTESVRRGLICCDEPFWLLECDSVRVCVCLQTKDWKRGSSNPVFPRLTLRQHTGLSRTIVFWQSDKHHRMHLEFLIISPGQEKKQKTTNTNMDKLPVNANVNRFHGGSTARWRQIVSTKHSSHAESWRILELQQVPFYPHRPPPAPTPAHTAAWIWLMSVCLLINWFLCRKDSGGTSLQS